MIKTFLQSKRKTSSYGINLNPYKKMREPGSMTGICQSMVITDNPSTIDQNQELLVRLPNLSNSDIIVPCCACLAFIIK